MSVRGDVIFAEMRDRVCRETDRMFRWLLLGQWLVAIGLALAISPYSFDGEARHLHFHVKLAVGLGALINVMPLALIQLRPGWWLTRHVIAMSQMLWSALLIMITGGRIETHFHVFGSLAFLAFYRDWKLLPTATLVVALDHLARGLWWPDSVYGVSNPEWWRFLEHATWVAFEDVVLVFGCVRQVRETRGAAEREAVLEQTNARVEREVDRRTMQLKESMDKYRALVETTAAIPFEWDREIGSLSYLAPQAADLLDCKVARLDDGNLLVERLHADDLARLRALTEAFAAGDRRADEAIDLRLTTLGGELRYIRMFTSAVVDNRRLIRGVILDVTQHKKLESELHQAQKLESVGRLAAGVAHEINTPIQFVGDSIGFVRDSLDELFAAVEPRVADDDSIKYLIDEYPKALDRALEGLSRVTAIVRSMRVFAHPEQTAMAPVDLNAALDSTLTIARNEYKYVADVETTYAALPKVMCQGGEINQVILNIVVNAAHAITEVVGTSGARGKIGIVTRRDGNDVVVSISDTGGGIPDSVRERIFDPFFTTKEVGRGTGQGLAISRGVVVDKHRGALTFDTAIGRGTTFHIRIPIEQPQLTTELAA